jgi:hypothetical protein
MEVAPDRLDGIIKADYDRWIAIIREAGIRRSNDWRLATEKSSNYKNQRSLPSEANLQRPVVAAQGRRQVTPQTCPQIQNGIKASELGHQRGFPSREDMSFFSFFRLGLRQLTPVEQ